MLRLPCSAAGRAATVGASHPLDPNLELVVVLETNDRMQLAMATGLLEDSGIPFFALGTIATMIQDVDAMLNKWVGLQVPRDREAEARELLEQLFQPVESPQVTEG